MIITQEGQGNVADVIGVPQPSSPIERMFYSCKAISLNLCIALLSFSCPLWWSSHLGQEGRFGVLLVARASARCIATSSSCALSISSVNLRCAIDSASLSTCLIGRSRMYPTPHPYSPANASIVSVNQRSFLETPGLSPTFSLFLVCY
jgi:hypothetical protein